MAEFNVAVEPQHQREPNMQDMKTQILDSAEQLMRTRGYNGFSYADIAEEVGTTKANIHHHFRTKEVLGKALIGRTKEQMGSAIADLQDHTALELLEHYMGFFEHSIDNDRVCLCGMLLAEDDGLPAQLRATNKDFVEWQLDWLGHVLSSGRDAGEVTFDGSPAVQASFIYSSIQGAHIVAKFRKDRKGFGEAMHQLLSRFAAGDT